MGVSDVIRVNRNGSIESVQVEVNITHSYRGDLSLRLVSPSGTSVPLFGRTAPAVDGVNNLVATFTSANVPALTTLREERAIGNWCLQVSDLAAVDIGTLNTWALTLGISSQQTEWGATPGLTIPDNSPDGIVSKISSDAGGILKGISVAVDITHTFRGDLSVTLESPKGDKVALKSINNNDSTDDLKQTYTTADTPDLRRIIDNTQEIRGLWKLHVKDNLAADTGKLNAWSLRLTV